MEQPINKLGRGRRVTPMTNRLATNQSQMVVWRWEGEAFGNTPAQELAGISINLRFPGQYFDQETGLHYNYFRYYDPAIGRYITSDPVGLEAGFNTYLYSASNPIRFLDHLGLKIVGHWILKPRLVDANADIPSIELLDLSVRYLPPGISLALVTLDATATAQGVLYCRETDDCNGEVTKRWIESPTAKASSEFQFHVPYRIGPLWWTIAWVAIDGGMTAYDYRHFIDALSLLAIESLLQKSLTQYCIASQN